MGWTHIEQRMTKNAAIMVHFAISQKNPLSSHGFYIHQYCLPPYLLLRCFTTSDWKIEEQYQPINNYDWILEPLQCHNVMVCYLELDLETRRYITLSIDWAYCILFVFFSILCFSCFPHKFHLAYVQWHRLLSICIHHIRNSKLSFANENLGVFF